VSRVARIERRVLGGARSVMRAAAGGDANERREVDDVDVGAAAQYARCPSLARPRPGAPSPSSSLAMKNVRRTMNVRRTARLLILALVFGMAMYAVYVVVWPSLPSSSAVVTPLELSHAATARGVVTLVNDGFAWEQPKPNKAGWTPEPESATCYTVPGRGFIGKRCAPSFVIAGAMKSGTTSLYAYLLQHPQIERVTEEPVDQPRTGAKSHKIKRLVKKPILAAKEVRFWMDPNYRRLKEELGGIDEALQWYYDLFAPIPAPSDTLDSAHESNRGKIAGEATPMYIVRHCSEFEACLLACLIDCLLD